MESDFRSTSYVERPNLNHNVEVAVDCKSHAETNHKAGDLASCS